MLKRGTGVVLLLVLVFSTLFVAAQTELPDPGILPDSPFYGLKKAWEAMGTAFTFGEEAQAQRALALAERRLAETQVMVKQGKPEFVADLSRSYEQHIQRAQTVVAQAAKKEQLAELVSQATSHHAAVLEAVYEQAPEQAKEQLAAARQKSITGNQEVLKVLAGENPQKAAEIAVKIAEAQLQRTQQAGDQGKEEAIRRAVDEYNQYIRLVNEISGIAQQIGKDQARVEELVARATEVHGVTLREILQRVPENARLAIEQAIAASQTGEGPFIKGEERGYTAPPLGFPSSPFEAIGGDLGFPRELVDVNNDGFIDIADVAESISEGGETTRRIVSSGGGGGGGGAGGGGGGGGGAATTTTSVTSVISPVYLFVNPSPSMSFSTVSNGETGEVYCAEGQSICRNCYYYPDRGFCGIVFLTPPASVPVRVTAPGYQQYQESVPLYTGMENRIYPILRPMAVTAVNVSGFPLTADAQADRTSGPVPLTINFTGNIISGVNVPLTFVWDFGDGNTTALIRHPIHTYTQEGTYTTRFTVTDSIGTRATDAVTITAAPFSEADTQPVVTAKIISNDASSTYRYVDALTITVDTNIGFFGFVKEDTGNFPANYTWDFGDGNTTSHIYPTRDATHKVTAHAVHSFSDAGTYTIRLTVIDNDGDTSTDTVTITAASETTRTESCTDTDRGINYDVAGNVSSGTTRLYDVCTGSLLLENYCQSVVGNVSGGVGSILYTCPNGCSTGACFPNSADLFATAIVTIPPEECSTCQGAYGFVPFLARFTGSVRGGYGQYTYLWDFGDGSTSIEQNPQHVFSNAGVYSVTFSVTDGSGRKTSSNARVWALRSEEACSETDGGKNQNVAGNTTGVQKDGVSGYSSYSDFCRAVGSEVLEFFCSGGFVDVEAITCPNGCGIGKCLPLGNVTITNITLTIPASCADTDNGVIANVTGTVSGVENDRNYTYTDSCTSSQYLQEWFCSGPSKMSRTLDCTVGGCVGGRCTSVNTCIDTDGGVVLNVAGSVNGLLNGVTYLHPDSCSGSALTEWFCQELDIGRTPSSNVVTCPYGCSNSICLLSPTTTLGAQVNVLAAPERGTTVSLFRTTGELYARSLSGVASFTIAAPVPSEMTLNISNQPSYVDVIRRLGLSPGINTTVVVGLELAPPPTVDSQPVADALANTTVSYAPATIGFTGSVTSGNSPFTYLWDFGDGSTSRSKDPTHLYNRAGDYNTRFTVTDTDGDISSDSITINILLQPPTTITTNVTVTNETTTTTNRTTTVTDSQPTADAVANATSGYVPLYVGFTGFVTSGDSPFTYSWNFGDRSTSTEQNPQHRFGSAGSYTVQFQVTDSDGDTSTDTVAITTQKQTSGEACNDTDGGSNPNVKGTVTGGSYGTIGYNHGPFTDYCRTSASSDVIEYYCLSDFVQQQTITCSYQCNDGACVSETLRTTPTNATTETNQTTTSNITTTTTETTTTPETTAAVNETATTTETTPTAEPTTPITEPSTATTESAAPTTETTTPAPASEPTAETTPSSTTETTTASPASSDLLPTVSALMSNGYLKVNAGLTPLSLFYQVELFLEQFQLELIGDHYEKAMYAAGLTQERVAEIVELLVSGNEEEAAVAAAECQQDMEIFRSSIQILSEEEPHRISGLVLEATCVTLSGPME